MGIGGIVMFRNKLGNMLIVICVLSPFFYAVYLGVELIGEVSESADTVIEREVYEVKSVKFKGESGFWEDKRKVVVDTEEGTFIYPEKSVTYDVARNDEFKIEIIQNGLGSEHVVLNVGEEMVKEIRTQFAEQFGQNIEFGVE